MKNYKISIQAIRPTGNHWPLANPIQPGYANGHYDEVISFMRNFLSGGLKDVNKKVIESLTDRRYVCKVCNHIRVFSIRMKISALW